jgi:hypothetical protein
LVNKMDIPKIQAHIDTLDDEALLLLVGELVLSETTTLGAKPPNDDEKKHAASKFASDASKAVANALKHPISIAVMAPGPLSTFIDFLAGMALQEFNTQVKLLAYAALAARYGLPRLLDKFGPKKGGE